MADRRSIIVEQTYVIAAEPEAVFDALVDAEVLSECLAPLQRLRLTPGSGGRIGFRDPELGPAIGRIGEHDRGDTSHLAHGPELAECAFVRLLPRRGRLSRGRHSVRFRRPSRRSPGH